MFGPVLTALAAGRQVITVDLQAHGRTADIARPLSYDAMADDIAGLIGHLDLASADVMGYSLGGNIAMRVAIRHPDVVRKLVIVSAPYARSGMHAEILAGMAQLDRSAGLMKDNPLYKDYVAVAPRPQDWPVLFTKMHALLMQDYDWSHDIAAIRAPTLLVVGDGDAVRTAHAVAFFDLLGGDRRDANWDGSGLGANRFAILPGVTHYTMFSSPALAAAAIPFLDGTMLTGKA
jgi:pimeloyl-ACP methyl ester carboxylesterase